MFGADPRNLLPTTGQTTSYAGSDDGALEVGIRFNNRFVVSDQGTVFDRSTNLEWIESPWLIVPGSFGFGQVQVARGDWADSTAYAYADLVRDVAGGNTFWVCILGHTGDGAGNNRPGLPDAAHWVQTVWTNSAAGLTGTTWKSMSWADSVSNSAALETNGRTDWRLPNIVEMLSIMDFEDNVSTYTVFDAMPQDFDRWASTTRKAITANAFRFRFDNVDVVSADKSGLLWAHPVRGGLHL